MGSAIGQIQAGARNMLPNVAYVGSEACGRCHRAILESYRKTGMGRSVTLPNDPAFHKESRITSEKMHRTFEVFARDGDLYQSESRTDGNQLIFRTAYRLEYAIGSGAHGVTFIVRRGDGLFQAPLSSYTRTGGWDLSPGYDQADYGFNRPIAAACLSCHSGRPQPLAGRNGAYADPPFRELAIGCENCHGPGELHVKERMHGPAPGREHEKDTSIVNPSRLDPRLAENICMNCHQTGDARVLQPGKDYADFRPGQWLSDTLAIFKIRTATNDRDLLEHHAAMSRSRCFVAGRGKLSCLTCHDPHVAVPAAQAAAYYRARCLICHTDASCRLPARARAPDNNCAGCHMPKRQTAFISHTALTNHRIAVPADQSPGNGQELSSGPELDYVNAPPGRPVEIPRITLLRAYSEILPSHPEFGIRYSALLDELSRALPDDPWVQSALGRKLLYGSTDDGSHREALEHLEKAVKLGARSADVQRDLAEALAGLQRLDDSVAHLKIALELAPYDPVLHKTLVLRLIALKNYPKALEAMRQYVDLFPEDDFMRDLLRKAENAK